MGAFGLLVPWVHASRFTEDMMNNESDVQVDPMLMQPGQNVSLNC